MNKLFTPRKFFLLLCFIISIQGFAAFIGRTGNDSGTKKISLKNFNRNNYRTNAFPAFRLSQFQFTGSQNIYQVTTSLNSIEGQSMIRLQNGNTTYVYPYKYKVKIPLFKTPAAPNSH